MQSYTVDARQTKCHLLHLYDAIWYQTLIRALNLLRLNKSLTKVTQQQVKYHHYKLGVGMGTLNDHRFHYFVIAVISSSQVNHQLSQDSLEVFLSYREKVHLFFSGNDINNL